MVNFGVKDMMPHFIFCQNSLIFRIHLENVQKIILKKMQEYGIQSLIFTVLEMVRHNLITKEKSKLAAEGKLKNDRDWPNYNGSINDDLDSFVNDLQNSYKTGNEDVQCFFTPKLTKEELKLVEEKNKEHMMTYFDGAYADVNVEEMKKSDSKDKYVHSSCHRITVYLNLTSKKTYAIRFRRVPSFSGKKY